jgi:hypothetical protein
MIARLARHITTRSRPIQDSSPRALVVAVSWRSWLAPVMIDSFAIGL